MKYKYIIPILFVAAGVVLFPSCQKELSCEGRACRGVYDDGKALYSFVQNNGLCASAVFKGAYFRDVKLNDSNTVTVKVNVNKPGVYTISTDTVNGFNFKSEGEFASTGITTVKLKGTGKPLKAGNYNFISSKISGCSFSVKVDTVPYVEPYFYEFDLDGKKYTDTVRGGVRITNYEDITSSQKDMLSQIGYKRNIILQNGASNYDGILIAKSYILSSLLDLTGLQNYFAPGNYIYRTGSGSENGLLVGWIDLNSPAYYWNTALGLQPPGSNFAITNVETYADLQGRPIAKVKATFNCILYNGYGQSKVLTNGKFYGEFANINR